MSRERTIKQIVATWLVLVFALLSGCATMNTTSDGADSKLMLKGHDPVAYFSAGKHTLGDPAIKTDYQGVTYRFASQANKDEFLKSPDKYVPQFGGFCSNGIAYGIPWGGDPDTWAIIDGKLYIFGGQSSRNYFLMDRDKNLKLANEYWDAEMKNMNSAFVQRWYRLIVRVPHYKTGAQLEEEWKAFQAKGGKI